MRTTDDLQEPERFQPLGAPVPMPAPASVPAPKPQGPSGIVYENGMPRTTNHKPYASLTLEEAIRNWRENYAADTEVDFLP